MKKLSLFDQLEQAAIKKEIPRRTREAYTFFMNKLLFVGKEAAKKETRAYARREGLYSGLPEPGRMYTFSYNPKYADSLNYYDTQPLIFCVDYRDDGKGFFGLNVHYISYFHRSMLFDQLLDITNNNKFDRSTKLNLSYKLLKSTEKYSLFKPCFKNYLFSQVRSKFIEFSASEYDMALFLPVHQFKKASVYKVWDDSLNKI